MASPSLPVRFIQPLPIQMAACVTLKVDHDTLRWNLGLHHCMDVSASHMRRQQAPATMHTDLLNRLQHDLPTDLVEDIGSLIHNLSLRCGSNRVPFEDSGSRNIVFAVG